MSLLKRHTPRRRHMGRRVAGVGLGVALIVLGLEAPAFAVTPTVTGFAPGSGADGCVVQITGTNFMNPTATAVTFDGDAADFQVISDTEIWATAPASVSSGAIAVTNGSGTGSSATGWLAGAPAGCTPTAASFAPTCGPVGTDVTITGTNLMQGVSPADGGDVYFSPFASSPGTGVLAPQTAPPTAPTLTSLTVNVPALGADGPIGVVTFADVVGAGSDFSATLFDFGTCITAVDPSSGSAGTTVIITGVGFEGVTSVTFTGAGGTKVQAIFTKTTDTETTDTITATVPVGAITGPLQVNTPGGNPTHEFTIGTLTHSRSVTLKLKDSLTLKGKVTVSDGFTDCAAAVPVKLQKKKKGGGWKTLKTVTTSATGAYSGKVANKHGKYRSVAPNTTAGGETCLKAVSPTRKH